MHIKPNFLGAKLNFYEPKYNPFHNVTRWTRSCANLKWRYWCKKLNDDWILTEYQLGRLYLRTCTSWLHLCIIGIWCRGRRVWTAWIEKKSYFLFGLFVFMSVVHVPWLSKCRLAPSWLSKCRLLVSMALGEFQKLLTI